MGVTYHIMKVFLLAPLPVTALSQVDLGWRHGCEDQIAEWWCHGCEDDTVVVVFWVVPAVLRQNCKVVVAPSLGDSYVKKLSRLWRWTFPVESRWQLCEELSGWWRWTIPVGLGRQLCEELSGWWHWTIPVGLGWQEKIVEVVALDFPCGVRVTGKNCRGGGIGLTLWG